MESKARAVALRALLLLVITGPLFASYFPVNQRADITHSQVFMPEWVPFFPILALPYLAILVTPAMGIFLIKDARRFRRYVISFIPAYGAVALIWIFFPTEMLRPEVPPGILNQVYRDLISVDRPVCILPCGHIVGPVLLSWALGRENRWHLRWIIPFLAIASLSIVTTWQHRPLDVLLGIAISLIAAFLCEKLLFTKKVPPPTAP